MKKLFVVSIFILCLIKGAFALPFSSSGVVDPNFNNSWNATSASGIARYYFYFENPNVSVNVLQLRFEADVFDITKLNSASFQVINPGSWTSEIFVENNAVKWAIASGHPITTLQDPIVLQVNYSLIDSDRMWNSQGTNWAWDEGQVWAQTYTLSGPLFWNNQIKNWDMPISGGSTSPVPEPATIALLGLGALGIIRSRKK
ncbi:MAG: PEP-CTERM sorting domain-containing protein [Candidatus Omnitrophica bacterium]|nr:PEP-CTERM sorting domain-containing protein [Candidatus Omnitrophota bacterium]